MTVLLWLGCVIDVPVNLGSTRTISSHSEAKADLEWRRTKDGWEKKSSWGLQQSNRRAPSAAVMVHPLVISLLELFLVSATFVAWAPSRQFAGHIRLSSVWFHTHKLAAKLLVMRRFRNRTLS